MKKVVSLLLVCVSIFCLCACGKPKVDNDVSREVFEEEDIQVTLDSTDNVITENTTYSTQQADAEETVEPVQETYKPTEIKSESNEPVSYHISEVSNLPGFDVPLEIEGRHITYDTPGHAGVNMRTGPYSSSELIMVLPEGTDVRFLETSKENHNYVKIAVTIGDIVYIGYVMQRYITSFTGTEYDCIVCYNTPDHAGAVLREKNSSDSKKIMVVPEGTDVRIVNNVDTGEYWAVKVFYNGEIYSGYILGKYIVGKE